MEPMGPNEETLWNQRQQLQEMAHAYRRSQVLLTCVELGVFDLLTGEPATSGEVAKAIGADARAVTLLLNAAAALGLLEKHEAFFSNSQLAESQLIKKPSGGMAHRMRMENSFYRQWGNLAEIVRTGYRPETSPGGEQPDGWVRTFIYGMYDMARLIAPVVAEALALPEELPLRALDVGGGHGGYSIALAQRYPHLTATVFELPPVVPVAQEIIEDAGLSERIQVQAGDFQQEELGAGYDLALVFGVLNGEPPAKRPALISKVYRALKPGGMIVLRDTVLNPDRAGPPEAAMFALQLLLATEGGGLDTLQDWTEWLTGVGFMLPETLELPEWVGYTLTVSRKPAA